MEWKSLTKSKLHHLLNLLENNEREQWYCGNRAQYWNRHRVLKAELEQLLINFNNPQTLKPIRYQCMLCGRDKFTRKSPHNCSGGFRKRNIEWLPIYK